MCCGRSIIFPFIFIKYEYSSVFNPNSDFIKTVESVINQTYKQFRLIIVDDGSTDGTFVYTGFKPAFVLTKASSSTGQWIIHDTARDPFNQANRLLYPSLSNAEENNISDQIDILSNGFKIRATGSAINGSGVTYIYMAFAENPLVGTNNIPATAR